jgi:hypothetical protein
MVVEWQTGCKCGWCQINRLVDLKIKNRIKKEGKVDGRRLGMIKRHHKKIRKEILLIVKNNKAYL